MCRFPKQYPAVPAMTWPPRPALCTSLIRPPVPVVAPLKGATPKTSGQIRIILKAQQVKKEICTVRKHKALCVRTGWEVVRLCGEDDVSQ